jgi:hypothetical protein
MLELPDSSTLKKISDYASRDATNGYLIHDVAATRTAFNGSIQQINTREMKLTSLGVFPLQDDALHLLSENITYLGAKLSVPTIFRESNIPIFAAQGSNTAYISPAGANICRYFYELWRTDEGEIDADHEVLSGFAILASYAGL